MTPEKALAILEGKISHREAPKSDLDKKKASLSIENTEVKDQRIDDFIDFTDHPSAVYTNKTNDFARVFTIVLILGMLIVGHLWNVTTMSEDSYKRGYNNGVASMNNNLTSVKQDVNDKVQQMDQLQQEIVQTRKNLESVTQQKDQLSQSLKEMQGSIPTKINMAVQPLEDKIKVLTEESQQKISDLNDQLSSAQKDISEKEGQLAAVQKILNDKVQLLNKLKQNVASVPPPQKEIKAVDKPVPMPSKQSSG